jgi:hypothetical protein
MRIRRGAVAAGITITTGYTFLPLNRIGKVTTFTVIPPVP